MKIGQISQCTKILDFKPRIGWPEILPAMALGDTLVAGFSREASKSCLYLDIEISLESTLAKLYPQMGFIEISRLWQLVRSTDFNWPELCAGLQMRYSDDWPRIFAIIENTPAEIVDWFESKGVGARDLAPLKAFQSDKNLAEWCLYAQKIISFQPSRSDGVQTLEWLVDLVLMNQTVDLSRMSSFSETRELVRALRFPHAAESERAHETLLSELPWPAKSKTAVIRRGDRDGFEIKLFVTSKDELQKQIASLQNVESQWGQET